MNRDITHQFRNRENAPWQFCSGVNSSSGIEKGSSSSSTATSSSLEAPTLIRPFSGISTRVNSKGYQWSFINIFKIHQQRLRTQVWQDSNLTSLKLTHPSRAVRSPKPGAVLPIWSNKTTLLTGRRNSILSNPSLSDYSSPLNDSYLRDSFNANNSENFNPSCQRSFAVKKKKDWKVLLWSSPTSLHQLKLMIFRGTRGSQILGSLQLTKLQKS